MQPINYIPQAWGNISPTWTMPKKLRNEDKRIRVIGLVGGIASGKSVVAAHLEKLGASVLNADREVAALLEKPEIYTKLISRWGKDIFKNSKVDKKKIASIIFEFPEEREFAQSLLWPILEGEINKRIEYFWSSDYCMAIDAALLFEAGWEKYCTEIWFVDTPEDLRLEYAVTNRGWTEEEYYKRERSQISLDVKRDKATYVLKNNGDKQELLDQVETLYAM